MQDIYRYTGKHETAFGAPALDYITLTTYNENAFDWIIKQVDTSDPAIDTFRGYRGIRIGGLRLLRGQQQGRKHFIVIGEGLASEWLVAKLHSSQEAVHLSRPAREFMKCTRVDTQVSVKDENSDLRDVADEFRAEYSIWRKGGKKPAVALLEGSKSKKGLGKTVYIGSRKTKNGTFIRIYEKEGPQQERYIRVELEMKGRKADKVYQEMMMHGRQPAVYTIHQKIQQMPANIVERFFVGHLDATAIGSKYDVAVKGIPSDEVRRALWMKYDVFPVAMKLENIDVIKWLKIELQKLWFCMLAREKLLERKANIEELEHHRQVALTQVEATLNAYKKEISEGSREMQELPTQGSLFSAEELARLAEIQMEVMTTEYR